MNNANDIANKPRSKTMNNTYENNNRYNNNFGNYNNF